MIRLASSALHSKVECDMSSKFSLRWCVMVCNGFYREVVLCHNGFSLTFVGGVKPTDS